MEKSATITFWKIVPAQISLCELKKLFKSYPAAPCGGQSGTLKTALLDYIKRCRPGDSEKHNMIALCFSMCREIGENHEAAARTQLKLIESQPWGEWKLQNREIRAGYVEGRRGGSV